MGSIRFYIDKKTGLAIGSEELDGRGKVVGKSFSLENISDYDKVDILTNSDAFLDSIRNGKRYEYAWTEKSESLWNENVLKPIDKYSSQIYQYQTISKNKSKEIDPEVPDVFELNDSEYEKLYETRDVIAQEQNKKIDEINLLQDENEKQKVINEYLPFYDESYKYVNEKISNFESKIVSERKRKETPEIYNYSLQSDKDSLFMTPDIIQYDQELSDKQGSLSQLNKQYSDANAVFQDAQNRPFFNNQGRIRKNLQIEGSSQTMAKLKPQIDILGGEIESLSSKKEMEKNRIAQEIEAKKQSRSYLLDPDLPELGNYNDTSDYDSILGLKELTLSERNKKISELNMIEDPIERYVAKEQELPQYDKYLNFASEKLVKAPRKDRDLSELSMFDENTDYEKLYGFQDQIISEQNKKIEELNLIEDPYSRFLEKEKELPQYDAYLNIANEKIGNLDARVENVRSRRKSDVSFEDFGNDFTYNDLIDQRNIIASKQNQKVSEINLIQDPAERYVAIEQDFPLFSNKLNEYDEKINQYGNILETRKPVDVNFNRDRRGNLEINLGGRQGKFRNTRRGIQEAENFYAQSKSDYIKDLSSADNITKNASLEQDIPYLNYNEKVIKQQKKAQKNQEMQNLINMNNSYTGDFGATAPSDTPTGSIRVPTPPPNRVPKSGLDKIFSQYNEPNFAGSYDYFTPKPRKGKKNPYSNMF